MNDSTRKEDLAYLHTSIRDWEMYNL